MEARQTDLIDANNPEVDVDDVMRRIREKLQHRREAAPTAARPAIALSLDAEPLGFAPIEQALARAQDVAAVGANVPAMSKLHGVKRAVAGAIGKAFLRVAQLITRDQRAFNFAIAEAVKVLADRARENAALRSEVAALRSDLAATRAEAAALRTGLQQSEQRLVQLGAEFERKSRDFETDVGQVRASVSAQERRLVTVLEEAHRRLSGPVETVQLATVAAELSHAQDALYLGFEDEFRGSREEIKQRVSVYLPRLRAAGAGTDDAPILDLGCGRGELLEVLRDGGLKASGVDTNRLAVEQCEKLGLDVRLEDAFAALAARGDASLGALTAIHVVEHLPFELLVKLLDESLRVLRPGGLVAFETPNPGNVLVGSCNFYIDPTHRNPVHPLTLRHLLEARGFVSLETLLLHPNDGARIPDGDAPLTRAFNDFFFGAQDYAIVGRRP